MKLLNFDDMFSQQYHTSPKIVKMITKEKLLWSFIKLFKLITNRWAWALVPTKLVEPGNALAWGGDIHGNPASGPHQAPSHWTIQWNTYRLNSYLAHTKREGGMGKTKAQTGTQTVLLQLLQQHFAKNCKQATAYISHEVPLLEASGHPYYSWPADQHCFEVNFA